MTLNEIADIIKKSETIAITMHTSADGDAWGSVMALCLAIRDLNKKAYIVSMEETPDNLRFLPLSYEAGKVSSIKENTDLIIVLDCGNVQRINSEEDIFKENISIVNIDHHTSNSLYGKFNFVDSKAAATAEILYDLIKVLGVRVTKDIATSLYTSIVTDTGSYRFSNTTLKTHIIAGELIDVGINHSEIHSLIFDNITFNKVKFLSRVLDNLYLNFDKKLAVIKISKKDIEDFNMEDESTSDIVSYGLKIDTVEVALLLKESDNGTKLSLRSKNNVDVNKIAAVFGGGGHVKAAGGFLELNLKESEEILLKEIGKSL